MLLPRPTPKTPRQRKYNKRHEIFRSRTSNKLANSAGKSEAAIVADLRYWYVTAEKVVAGGRVRAQWTKRTHDVTGVL